jgi:DNA repair photolyase
MSAVQYEEIECRSAVNRVEGMTFRWSLNPYQGCVHGCHLLLRPPLSRVP